MNFLLVAMIAALFGFSLRAAADCEKRQASSSPDSSFGIDLDHLNCSILSSRTADGDHAGADDLDGYFLFEVGASGKHADLTCRSWKTPERAERARAKKELSKVESLFKRGVKSTSTADAIRDYAENLRNAQATLDTDDKLLLISMFGKAHQQNIVQRYFLTQVISALGFELSPVGPREALVFHDSWPNYYVLYDSRIIVPKVNAAIPEKREEQAKVIAEAAHGRIPSPKTVTWVSQNVDGNQKYIFDAPNGAAYDTWVREHDNAEAVNIDHADSGPLQLGISDRHLQPRDMPSDQRPAFMGLTDAKVVPAGGADDGVARLIPLDRGYLDVARDIADKKTMIDRYRDIFLPFINRLIYDPPSGEAPGSFDIQAWGNNTAVVHIMKKNEDRSSEAFLFQLQEPDGADFVPEIGVRYISPNEKFQIGIDQKLPIGAHPAPKGAPRNTTLDCVFDNNGNQDKPELHIRYECSLVLPQDPGRIGEASVFVQRIKVEVPIGDPQKRTRFYAAIWNKQALRAPDPDGSHRELAGVVLGAKKCRDFGRTVLSPETSGCIEANVKVKSGGDDGDVHDLIGAGTGHRLDFGANLQGTLNW